MIDFSSPACVALIELADRLGFGLSVTRDTGAALSHVFSSPNLTRMTGVSPAQMPGRHSLASVAGHEQHRVSDLIVRLRQGAEPPPFFEFVMTRQDGTEFTAEATTKIVVDGDARIYVTLIRDLSAGSAPLSMFEADRLAMVNALAAGVAHEINNPLTYLLLHLRTLRRTLIQSLPPDVLAGALRALDDAAEGAERIKMLVRAAMSISASSPGPTRVDLAAVVHSALRLVSPVLEDRTRIIKDVTPVGAVEVEESRIGQAVMAMLLFAGSGFTVDDPLTNLVVVTVEQRGRNAVVEIADNGSSLTEDECRHAFDPRFSSAARGAGVGVGLAVARSMALGRGGEVTLGNRTGGGLVLTMTMLLMPAEVDAPA